MATVLHCQFPLPLQHSVVHKWYSFFNLDCCSSDNSIIGNFNSTGENVSGTSPCLLQENPLKYFFQNPKSLALCSQRSHFEQLST